MLNADSIKLTVERSLSGIYWCVVLNGDTMHPLAQRDTKWQAERELELLMKASTKDAFKIYRGHHA